MSEITVKGLKVIACHGVLKEEKVTPQPFIFDINMECDTSAAVACDDVSATVNYAEVCRLVTEYCLANGFNLIERLAYGAAFMLAEKFYALSAVTVTVHKPQAPVGLPFSDISVTERVERNGVVLSLGSNMGNKKAELDGALSDLSAIRGLTVLNVSKYLKTQPYGGAADGEFLNCAVTVDCLLTPRALLDEIHRIENGHGRVRTVRWGDRTLDMDIIFFGNKIIAEEGLCVPHPDYFNRTFVLQPLAEIAPDFVCPLKRKRIADLYGELKDGKNCN